MSREGGQLQWQREGKLPEEFVAGLSRDLHVCLDHPVRRQLLRTLNQTARPSSPTALAHAIEQPVPTVAYHVRTLAGHRGAKSARAQRGRGVTQTFYVSLLTKKDRVSTILSRTKALDTRLLKGNR